MELKQSLLVAVGLVVLLALGLVLVLQVPLHDAAFSLELVGDQERLTPMGLLAAQVVGRVILLVALVLAERVLLVLVTTEETQQATVAAVVVGLVPLEQTEVPLHLLVTVERD